MRPQGLEKIRKSYYAISNDKLPKQLLQFLCWTRGLKQYYYYFFKEGTNSKNINSHIHNFCNTPVITKNKKLEI